IYLSKSPQMSSIFFIPKKDRGKQMVMDYHHLNKGMVKNNYLLPLISQLVDCLKGCTQFMKMDLRWGYNNVRIKQGDKWKGTFITQENTYEPLVMFFGMCNSPSTFQQMMNDVFLDIIYEGILVIYMDDLLVCTCKEITKEEHMTIVCRVLQWLQDNDPFVKPFKCCFSQEVADFLGMIMSSQ